MRTKVLEYEVRIKVQQAVPLYGMHQADGAKAVSRLQTKKWHPSQVFSLSSVPKGSLWDYLPSVC